jgi:hypothetical protein
MIVVEPHVRVPGRMLDFGAGFYTTTDIEQARNFTKRFTRAGKNRILNIYSYDDERAAADLSILTFDEADESWLRYVVTNRSGAGTTHDYDIVKGPVADDRVYDVVEAFEIGVYSEAEAISRLLAFRLTDQVVFKSDASFQYLLFENSLEVDDHE